MIVSSLIFYSIFPCYTIYIFVSLTFIYKKPVNPKLLESNHIILFSPGPCLRLPTFRTEGALPGNTSPDTC